MKTSILKQYSVPFAVIVAGALIAGAIFFSPQGATVPFENNLSDTANNVRPVDIATDHVKGNLDAEVSIIEYSDYECPFCQRVHPTLERIVEDFDGKVKWAYRHFPLTSIHSKALNASIAGDCVARLGGNEAFWTFTDSVFENQRHLGTELYESIALELGISLDDFRTCQSDPSISEAIEVDYQNAIDSGGRGTPFIIVTNKSGDTFPFSGALPYEQIQSIIEQALES